MTDVAKTTLAQLGGNKFIAMTGATKIVFGQRTLAFDLPKSKGFVKDGINRVEVELKADDTYTVRFFKVRPRRIESVLTPIRTRVYVFADNLRDVFETETGLATSL